MLIGTCTEIDNIMNNTFSILVNDFLPSFWQLPNPTLIEFLVIISKKRAWCWKKLNSVIIIEGFTIHFVRFWTDSNPMIWHPNQVSIIFGEWPMICVAQRCHRGIQHLYDPQTDILKTRERLFLRLQIKMKIFDAIWNVSENVLNKIKCSSWVIEFDLSMLNELIVDDTLAIIVGCTLDASRVTQCSREFAKWGGPLWRRTVRVKHNNTCQTQLTPANSKYRNNL